MGGVCSTPTIEKSVEGEALKETATTQEELKVTEAAEATKEEAPKEEAPKEDAVAKPTIKVFGCRGLRNADWTWIPGSANLSDAYVICKEKKGEELKELFQTKTIPNSLEPIFDEEFDVEYGTDSILEFTVYDHDPLKPDDILGCAVLNCASLTSGFNGELELTNAGKNIKAYMKVLVKTPSCDYPPGPATEFKITFEKGKKKALGFEFDKTSADVLFVTSIGKTGPVKEYNDKVEASEQMKTGQYIVAVNDAKDRTGMIQELKKEGKVVLSMVRPLCFTVAINKKGPLGVTVGQAATSNLITVVRDDGPVMEWNASHKDKEVKVGDRVLAVNGSRVQGKAQMALLKKDGPLQIVFCRQCPPAEATRGFWYWF